MEFTSKLRFFSFRLKIKLFMSHAEANTFLPKHLLMIFMAGAGMMKDNLGSGF